MLLNVILMKNICLAIGFSLLCFCSCKEPKDGNICEQNPCLIVHDNGLEFDPGTELIDGVCSCPEDKFSAYGTCRALKEKEWYGISVGCPCEDTLFLWLSEENVDGVENRVRFTINSDIFDPGNLDVEYGFTKARLSGGGRYSYFPSLEGDSIAPVSLLSYLVKCEVPGSGPEFDEVTLYGRFSPDMDTLFGKFIYRDGLDRLIVLDSCDVVFVR